MVPQPVRSPERETAISDERLKKNMAPIDDALTRLLSLRGFSFEWIDPALGQDREMGVLAQDVEKVFPDLVQILTDRKFVNYQGLIPVLIEALREMRGQVVELRDRVLA